MTRPVTTFPPLPTIQELIRLYNLRARKHLAQNFLLDRNLTNKIVRCAGKLMDGFVCEVGPGPGGITRSLLSTQARHVVVVEKDTRFLPSLQLLADVAEDRMKIVHGDILQYNIADEIPPEYLQSWTGPTPNIHLIGNLPFNVSTPLIIRWLRAVSERTGPWAFGRTRMTLTFQKEVAERMVAPVKNEERCRLSVMCQHLCDVRLKFIIPGKAFVPPPKVDVGVVHLVPLLEPRIKLPFRFVEKVNRHLFHYPNKFAQAGIRTLFPPDHLELSVQMFEAADVNPESRPKMLHMDQIERLCQAYWDICQTHPDMFDYDYRSHESALQRRPTIVHQAELARIESELLADNS